MRTKKFLLALVLCVTVFTASAFAVEVEDALTPAPEQSVYAVFRLDDTQALLKWIFSKEHVDTFMPLILASESSNEILGAVEMISAFAENTPLKSAALLVGVMGDKNPEPFFKMAFNVKDDAEPFVKKISDGTAEAVDIAKLVMGKNNPMVSFAETMIKVEKADDNILKVDNELFLKAQDGMIIAGLSADDVKNSLNALEDEKARLFTNKARRFAPKDFAWFHVDAKTLDTLDEDDEVDIEEVEKYLDKPLDVELGFMRVPGKFLLSIAANLKDALTEKAFAASSLNRYINKTSKGGYINLAGAKNPLLVLAGMFNVEGLKMSSEGIEIWNELVKQAKNRFGISEDDLRDLFAGSLSITVNDNVTIEGIKVPAFYFSLTGKDGTAEKIFEKLEKSPYLHKVQDGVLQVNTDLSPAPCFITRKGNELGINVAELANISAETALKPELEELLKVDSISSSWIDFAGIQSWILAPENGVLTTLEPIARIFGQGELYDACKEVLEAKFSVQSMSMHSDSIEVVHTEFAIDENVKAEDGFLAKLVKISKKFLDLTQKVEEKPEEEKSESK